MTALVTHAAGRISYYELWNEPDCKCFWSGTTAQLVRMGKDAAAIIRSLDPNAKILSPSAHGPTMATWFDGYVAAGGAANFDIVNVHMRGQNGTNGRPEAFLTVYGQVIAETQKRNLTSLPLWDDEHGILSGSGRDRSGHARRLRCARQRLCGPASGSNVSTSTPGTARLHTDCRETIPARRGIRLRHGSSATRSAHALSAGTVYTCALDNGLVVWDTVTGVQQRRVHDLKLHVSRNYVWSSRSRWEPVGAEWKDSAHRIQADHSRKITTQENQEPASRDAGFFFSSQCCTHSAKWSLRSVLDFRLGYPSREA